MSPVLARTQRAFPSTEPFPIHSLYVHLPFCTARCAYCDFFSFSAKNEPRYFSLKYENAYVDAILQQAKGWSERFGAGPFSTVYIGGGTPSVLHGEALGRLLDGLGPYVERGCEWTIEANPDSLTGALLDTFASSGVTRISLGVQTLSDTEWEVLHRVGSIEESKRAIELARAFPFELSVDVLAGIPRPPERVHESKELILDTLAYLADRVSHISVYDLTLEDGTPLQRQVALGALVCPDEDEMAEVREQIDGLLAESDFRRYEVSNYARSGHECRHNSAYWDMKPYLGLGSGAVSTIHYASPRNKLDTMLRITGEKNMDHYVAEPADIPADIEYIDGKTAFFEFLMMGFRTTRGVDTERIGALFGLDVEQTIPATLARWRADIIRGARHIALQPRRLDILNRFLVECLEELEQRGF